MKAFGVIVFCILIVLNILMSNNISYLPIVIIYFFIGYAGIYLLKLNITLYSYFNIYLLQLVFLTIAYIFYKYLNDPLQIISDAGNFYNLSKNYDDILIDGKIINDGYGAILIWHFFYLCFKWLGFALDNYIGTIFNSILVVWTFGIVRKIFRNVEGFNDRIFKYLFFSSPVIIVFYSLHLRDCFIMFLFAIYFLIIFYHSINRLINTFILFIVNIIISLIMIGFRDEFVFIPSIIFVFYLIFKYRSGYKTIFLIICMCCIFAFSYSYISSIIQVDLLVDRFFDKSNSKDLSISSSSANSLGVLLLYSNFLIRNSLGFLYFLFIPVPFYQGLFTNNFYFNFFSLNSFHALFCYIFYFLNYFNFFKLSFFYKMLNSIILFMFFLIVNTSFELRHIALFFPYIFAFISTIITNEKVKIISFSILILFIFEQCIFIIK